MRVLRLFRRSSEPVARTEREVVIYIDDADGKLKVKEHDGTVHIVAYE